MSTTEGLNMLAQREAGLTKYLPRKGSWIQTYTGRQFWPLDARPDEIDILDIAHALSMQCRYTGHCIRFYSVAEHCVLLALMAPRHLRKIALHHDDPEAYLTDVAKPIKPELRGYEEIEDDLYGVIAYAFDLPESIPYIVKDMDRRALLDERDQNMSTPPADWAIEGEGLGITLQFWSPRQAKHAFLTLHKALEAGDEVPFELHPWFLAGPVRLAAGRAFNRLYGFAADLWRDL